MLSKAHLLLLLLIRMVSSDNSGFTFYKNLKLNGAAEIEPNGVFKLINETTWGITQICYSLPFSFKNSSTGNAFSFSTMFVFEIVRDIRDLQGLGMAFRISPSKEIPGVMSSPQLGLINVTLDGQPYHHTVSIELDTSQEIEFKDINDNHVGININSVASIKSSPAGYFANENGEFTNLTLASGEPMQAWVDYDAMRNQLNVTLSPIHIKKPKFPLLSLKIDLSDVILDQMYVGFASSVGVNLQSHYLLGWSFQLNGKAQELDISRILSLQHEKTKSKKKLMILAFGLSGIGVLSALTTVFVIIFFLRRKVKFIDILEDWEVQYGPHRFLYKDLFVATKGFRENEILGKGGFGEVYRGYLRMSNTQVAVKRISHDSRQGMKEFVAEIATIGRLRHPNLVRLLGYCRREGELFLVYDFMPNSSLDKLIFNIPKTTLEWNQRFKVIKDVASGLAYLHEEWVEVIIHRDIKASNVLLDGELNGKLGDFGLARCSNHGQDPQTTHIAGTLGYIAPELARNGKVATSTDVFAFGAFCLEVACGRRPVDTRAMLNEVILVDWVLECWRKGEILKTVDPKLQNEYKVEEITIVLKIGLFCSHTIAAIRPSMSQVVQYLKGLDPLPDKLDALLLNHEDWQKLGDRDISSNSDSKLKDISESSLTITESLVTTGR